MGMIDYLGRSPSRKRLLAGDTPHWVANSPRQSYISQVILSAPPWVDLRALKALQAQAREATLRTGHLHVLDHIIPLNHPLVCGLTVPWNLRVLHWKANGSKGNDWCPDQMDLFEEIT